MFWKTEQRAVGFLPHVFVLQEIALMQERGAFTPSRASCDKKCAGRRGNLISPLRSCICRREMVLLLGDRGGFTAS